MVFILSHEIWTPIWCSLWKNRSISNSVDQRGGFEMMSFRKCCKNIAKYHITYDCGLEDQELFLCDYHYNSNDVFKKFIKVIEEIKKWVLTNNTVKIADIIQNHTKVILHTVMFVSKVIRRFWNEWVFRLCKEIFLYTM